MTIGSVRIGGAARTPYVQAATQSIQGFGQVGDALSRVANRLQIKEEKLRLEEERSREQSENFLAATRWTEKQGEWSRSQTDYLMQAPENGAGLTENRHKQLLADRDAFIQTLPERLREEYIARTEATLQDFATNTFQEEHKLRFNYQTKELTKTAGNLASEIRAGRGSMEAALAEFDEVLAASALPEATRSTLRDQVHSELAAAQFARIVQDAMEEPTQVNSPESGRAASSGLRPNEERFLFTVAAKESGGDYFIRYDGGAGTKFTVTSDHPRVFVRTKNGDLSSAAGKYQFTAGTWDDLVRRYGKAALPDFSPASQDRAAILLARERYNGQKTGGMRTFDALMNDATDEELKDLRKILGGVGKATTWQAFQKMTDGDFIALFRGDGAAKAGTGSRAVPDVWNDPRFADLPYDTKISLAGQAQSAINSINAAAEAQRKQFADMLRANIAMGTAGAAEVDDAVARNLVPVGDYDALIKLVDKERQAAQAAQSYGESVASGSPIADTKENRDAAATFMQRTGVIDGLREQSPEASAQLSTLFAAGGILPDEVSGLLTSMARSVDPRQVTYAMDTLSDMRAKNYDMFAASVGKDMAELEGVWALAKKYSPMGDTAAAIDMLKNFRDPAQAQMRETLRKEARKQLESISDKNIEKAFDLGFFSRRPNMPMSPQARGILRSDFNKLYETYYPMFGDEKATTEFAVQQMQYSWGVDEVAGNNRLMYLGPTSAVSGYSPIEGSYDWLREDLLSGMGWDDNVEFELVADGQTEADIQARRPASYTVIRRDDEGQFRTEFDENGAPLRLRFTQSEELIQSQRDKVLERNLTEKLQRLEAETDTRHMDETQHKLGDQDAIEKTRDELEELRQRRRSEETKKRNSDSRDQFQQNYNFSGDE